MTWWQKLLHRWGWYHRPISIKAIHLYTDPAGCELTISVVHGLGFRERIVLREYIDPPIYIDHWIAAQAIRSGIRSPLIEDYEYLKNGD